MSNFLDVPFGELFLKEPFHAAQPFIIPLHGMSLEQAASKSVREVMVAMLGWVPPHAEESLAFLNDENQKRPVYHPYANGGGAGAFYFRAEKAKGVAFIFPGGGYYSVCALAEGYPFAMAFLKRGYHAVVVGYRTYPDAHYPNAVEDAAEAIRGVYRDKLLGEIPPTSLFLGFSAGGHLAGVMASQSEGFLRFNYPRPDTLVLAYPVTSFVLPTHEESRSFFLGEKDNDASWRARFSLENLVGPSFPKTYCWGCDQDPCVPQEGMNALESQLKGHNIPYVRKTYIAKAHGWALGENTPAEGWLSKAVAFHEGGLL